MPQISISKNRILAIGEPPNGVRVAVEKEYVDFVGWGEGVEVAVRLTRREVELQGKAIADAMATGATAAGLILPGRT